MKFEETKILDTLSEAWSWLIPEINHVLMVNSMGNCFIKDINGRYWRICPEDLSATMVAETESDVQQVFADPEYKKDWQFLSLVNPAEDHFGSLNIGQCYAMIKPAVLGGEYTIENLRVGSVYEYLSFTGELAFKTKDLKDGEQVTISFT